MQIRTVLYPTDFSDASREALPYAVKIAQDWGAALVILHAVETLGPENVTYGEAISQAQPAAYDQRLWNDLRQVQVPDSHLRVDYLLSEENPVKAILRTALERDCDLIVIGSHGRQGLRRLFEGSIAEQVVRGATCPVLVIKASDKSTESARSAAAAESGR
jgi:nucleotide-binding universal stress UspA family protein